MKIIALEMVGLLLNFSGTVMVATSFGRNPENAHSTADTGRPVYLASFLSPKSFRFGLTLIAIGFLLQLMALILTTVRNCAAS